jgi:hypothetical protein
MVEKVGDAGDVVDYYLGGLKTVSDFNRYGDGAVRVMDSRISNSKIFLGEDLIIEVDLEAIRDVEMVDVSFDIKDEAGKQIAHVSNYDDRYIIPSMKKGEKKIINCRIKSVNLAPGGYSSDIWIGNPYVTYDNIVGCVLFRVTQDEVFIKRDTPYDSYSTVVLKSEWR